ncbi:MAG: 1-deoxy-D-xylulose-5-phosphate reductoisomerase [bacterium]|nr:1-deoxy-D-xylulose-5-phosphate reductoisomerase [bacterium]
MKSISILGSTGSVGTQTLDVIKRLGFKVSGLTANSNTELLEKQIAEFKPELVAVMDKQKAEELEKKTGISVLSGIEGLNKVASMDSADYVVTSVVGSVGLIPTLEAIKAGKRICLANKETLVTAGDIVMNAAEKNNVEILPVDSEHSAIFQCLRGENTKEAKRIILTASGGPFRSKTKEELQNVTVEQALNHPTWNMGSKITIDSSTLMNKGFEVIEAHHLFGMDYEKIDTVVHPQSIVHSMVEFFDSSIIAHLGMQDMRVPIQFALTYPHRSPSEFPRLDPTEKSLTFEKTDMERFPCIYYAYEAGKIGGTMPAVLNAANEIAVKNFLAKKISYLDIPATIKTVMDAHKLVKNPELNDVVEADAWARKEAEK